MNKTTKNITWVDWVIVGILIGAILLFVEAHTRVTLFIMFLAAMLVYWFYLMYKPGQLKKKKVYVVMRPLASGDKMVVAICTNEAQALAAKTGDDVVVHMMENEIPKR